VSTQWYSGD